jgi:hypothetical protein
MPLQGLTPYSLDSDRSHYLRYNRTTEPAVSPADPKTDWEMRFPMPTASQLTGEGASVTPNSCSLCGPYTEVWAETGRGVA